MRQKDLQAYLKLEMPAGVTGAARVIDPASVVTAPWVRLKCLYGCKDQTWCCPPYSPKPEETRAMLDGYRRAILYNYQVPPGVGSRDLTRQLKEQVVRLEGEMFKDGFYKAFAFLQGPCLVCRDCGRQTGASAACIFPGKTRPSMEACGIDVFQTARSNGFEIVPLRTRQDLRNHFCLIVVD